ncbi:hypothetical protein BKA15_006004 [Microlunatus parietis]|uniref:Uncharacterized protein n=1 Tax=Microlunatus parietis TaxID=682979 RepID=A0A7Y9ID87_9ACTN|nr:hypothetical protein [Microlunatus parietis]
MTSMAGPTQWLPVAADPRPSPGTRKRPHRWRPLAAALLACLLLLTFGCRDGTDPPPSTPSPSSSSTGTTASPTPAPTPVSARDQAIADSKQAYIEFWRAQDRVSQSGGATRIPAYMEKFLDPNGPARESYLDEIRSLRSGGFKSTGSAILRNFRMLSMSELDVRSPEVRWHLCVDQTDVKVTRRGAPYQHPQFLDEQPQLRLDKTSGRWLVYLVSSRVIPKNTGCA